jgi:hypothetical protein
MLGRRTGLNTSLLVVLGHRLRLYGPTEGPKIVPITAAEIIIIIIIIIIIKYLSTIHGKHDIKYLQTTAILALHTYCGKYWCKVQNIERGK